MGQPGNILFTACITENNIAVATVRPLYQKTPGTYIPTKIQSLGPGPDCKTFLLVNISWYFDMAQDLKASLIMMKNTVTGFPSPPLRTNP